VLLASWAWAPWVALLPIGIWHELDAAREAQASRGRPKFDLVCIAEEYDEAELDDRTFKHARKAASCRQELAFAVEPGPGQAFVTIFEQAPAGEIVWLLDGIDIRSATADKILTEFIPSGERAARVHAFYAVFSPRPMARDEVQQLMRTGETNVPTVSIEVRGLEVPRSQRYGPPLPYEAVDSAASVDGP
jgi:hypothetical protein